MNLHNAFPTRISCDRIGAYVHWVEIGGMAFTEPFVSHTLARALEQGRQSGTMMTPIEALPEIAASYPHSTPSAFIFHVSRCGSTVVSRALAQSPKILVASQPDVLTDILALDTFYSRERIQEWLGSLIAIFGKQRGELAPKYYILKLTSHLLLDIELFKVTFPAAKRIFVYREPIAVMVSVIESPTSYLQLRTRDPLRAAKLVDLPPEEAAHVDDEEYVARVVARMYRQICFELSESCKSEALCLNYRSLPAAIWERIVPFLGYDCSSQELAMMCEASRFDAKLSDQRVFVSDSDAKWLRASEKIRRRAACWAEEPYRLLEKIRYAQAERAQ